MRQLYNFKMGTKDDPGEKLFETEDFHVKLNNARMSVGSNTLYACFVSALPAAEYSLEIRDLNLKRVYDRNEIINLVRSKVRDASPIFWQVERLINIACARRKREEWLRWKGWKDAWSSRKVWKRQGRQRQRHLKRWSRESEGFDEEVFPMQGCRPLQRQLHRKALRKVWWERTQEKQVHIAGGHGRIASGRRACDGGGSRR